MAKERTHATATQKVASQLWLRVGVWVVLGGLFVQFIKRWPVAEDWRAIFPRESLSALLCLGGAFVMATVFRTVRWMVLLRSMIKVNFFQAVAVFGWSFLLMTVTPFRAGELLRPAWVKKQTGSFFRAWASWRLNDLRI